MEKTRSPILAAKTASIALIFAISHGLAFADAAADAAKVSEAVENLKKATNEFKAITSELNDARAAYPSDNDRYDGDQIELKVNICKFNRVDEPTPAAAVSYCAPSGSVMSSKIEKNNKVYVFFKSIGAGCDVNGQYSKTVCPNDSIIKFTQYTIEKEHLLTYSFKRTGVKFGALIVPFKFRVGGRHELVSSATVAPYMGLRKLTFLGTHFDWIASAGLSVVPVADTATGSISSKAAPSLSTGFLISNDKNSSFNSGVLLGWDFLSTADRKIDPDVNKAWVSVFIGYGF